MTARGPANSSERRVVTALFCDVVGSTSIAETMDPEDWSELVGETMAIMGKVVDLYGGTISEFGGDAVVALFGAPVAHEDDPYRATRAGLEIVREVQESSAREGRPLDVRVGINTGLVVVGEIEAGSFNRYSALGDTVNVAARLQTLARPGSVVVSAETRRLLGDDVDAVELGPSDLKGREAQVVVYEVVDLRGLDARRRGITGLSSPMVGRADELGALEGLTTASTAGTGRVAAILGEPGVGKSRLIGELANSLRGGDGTWASGSCVPFDDELPYHLLASLVRSLAGVDSSQGPDVIVKAIDALTERTDTPGRAETLQRLVGISGDYEPLSPEALREAYSEAILDVVSALGRDSRPCVLVCEDTHWADASSVDLMADLIERIPTLPVLLVIAMRPDRASVGWGLLETARRELGESLTEMRLEPLDEDSSRSLVSNLLEIDSLPPTLRRLVLDKSAGNPFFLEEVVRMLIERDVVERREGRWVAREEADELEVPGTVQGLLASRIDMLEPEVRRAGRVAAVIGRSFSSKLFQEVYEPAGNGGGTLHPHLATLETHGMIGLETTRPDVGFAFSHALVHDVMYEGLLRRERRELHSKVASAIESLYPDRLDEFAPALARHHLNADQAEDALPYLFTAGRRALDQGARVEAARFYGQAQELLESDPDSDPSALVDAVIGRVTAGQAFTPGPESLGWIEKAIDIAEELDDPDRLAALHERAIWTRGIQGETYANPGYRAQLDAGYALVPRLSDPGIAALLEAMMGGAHRSADEYEASIEPLSQAVDDLEEVGRLSEASYNAAMLADSLSQIGRFDEAVAAVERASDLARRSGDLNAVGDADIIHGSIAADRGRLQEALEHTRRGIETAEQVGNTFCSLAGNFKLADQQLRLGEVESAISHLETSTGLAAYCNAGGYEALGNAWLALARSRMGDLRPDDFEEPLASAVESGSRSSEGLVRLKRAIAFAGSGEPENAADDFEKAIDLFASYGGLPNLARAHHAYGQALEAAGRPEDAASHLHAAEDLFHELGIEPDPMRRA